MSSWKTLKSTVVYETPWIKVRRDEVLDHNSKQLTYSVTEYHSPAVAIIALNEASELLMQRVYRYPIAQTCWEIPAGGSDGQDPLAAAKRELLEEAGVTSDDWHELGTFYEANGSANFPSAFFLARNAHSVGSTDHEAGEDIRDHTFMPIKKIEAMIRNGEISDIVVPTALKLIDVYAKKKERK